MSTDVVVKTRTKKKKKGFSLERRRAASGYIFVMPFIIGFIVFMLYPLITSLYWSLGRGDISVVNGKGSYVMYEILWFQNYKNIITEDVKFMEYFIDTIQRTFIWTPFIIVFSLFIAILLNKKIKFRGVFRVIYFLPVLLGTGLVYTRLSTVTDQLTIPHQFVNLIEYVVGSEGVKTFVSDLITNIISMFWKTGVQIVIFLAALQGISDSLYEAAKVDSANWWDTLWKVTIPIISPMILLNTIYTIIDSFRDASNPIVNYIVSKYTNADWTFVSAMGWLYFLVTLVILGIIFAATRRLVFYEK